VRGRLLNARRPISVFAAAAFLALAAIGAWRSFDGVWTSVGTERLAYRGMTPFDRENAAAGGLADTRVLDFWAERVHRGDRYFLNVPPSTKTQPQWFALLSQITGYYLVPAVRVNEPQRANVVLSWGRAPARAGLSLRSSVKLSGIDASVSRVAR
jgi:hypothetical protein